MDSYGYDNLKSLQDNKECNWGGGGWKVEGNSSLVIINLDTVYADILVISDNYLVFKAHPHTWIPGKWITYSFQK
jgi:hypothetical protein